MFGGLAISFLMSAVPIAIIIILIYLIYKRLKDKENEGFEKRNY
ncbi:MAG: hypothetical protein U9R42_07155 [Bacteroidota bacterium]|nr:hypothetical protein [Bacteroidota bacterium]